MIACVSSNQDRPRLTIRRRGFSLIEVVISVVVLSLGLLGVLAAFPSVIELQRRAQDDVLGGAALGAAEATIRSTIFESEQLVNTTDEGQADVFYTPRELVFLDSGLSAFSLVSNSEREMTYLWGWQQLWRGREGGDRAADNPGEEGPIHSENGTTSNLLKGILTIGGGKDTVRQGGVYIDPSPPSGFFPLRVSDPSFSDATVSGFDLSETPVSPNNPRDMDRFEIPVSTRLFPQPGSGSQPRYVWDFVMRRVDAGFEEDDGSGNAIVRAENIPFLPVQVAIFVRRIDTGIRIPSQINSGGVVDNNFTLAEALTGVIFETGENVPDDFRRLPVSARAIPGGLTRLGRGLFPTIPTNDGAMPTRQSGYSPILGSLIRVNADRLDVIEFRNPANNSLEQASIRAEAGKPLQILIDNNGNIRRVLEVLERDGSGVPTSVRIEPAYSSADFQVEQAVFTPQIPVAVQVLELQP